jgi:hypothetical protein
MTLAQITAILGEHNLDQRVYIPEMNFISFGKDKNVTFSEIQRTRFFFDTTEEVLEISLCRPYSRNINELPLHGKYDIIEHKGEQIVFEYLVDKNGEIIADYYGFESVSLINLRKVAG